MYIIFSILIIITCILLVLIVLVQSPKGGLASNFAGSNQIMGVRRTTDFLEKATWILAVGLLAFSLLASMTIPRSSEENRDTRLKEQIQNYERTTVPTLPQTEVEPGTETESQPTENQ